MENGKKRNVTMDVEAQEALQKVQDLYEKELGFRPNITQTIKHLIKLAAANTKRGEIL